MHHDVLRKPLNVFFTKTKENIYRHTQYTAWLYIHTHVQLVRQRIRICVAVESFTRTRANENDCACVCVAPINSAITERCAIHAQSSILNRAVLHTHPNAFFCTANSLLNVYFRPFCVYVCVCANKKVKEHFITVFLLNILLHYIFLVLTHTNAKRSLVAHKIVLSLSQAKGKSF